MHSPTHSIKSSTSPRDEVNANKNKNMRINSNMPYTLLDTQHKHSLQHTVQKLEMAKEGAKHEYKHKTCTDYDDTIYTHTHTPYTHTHTIHTHTHHKWALQHTVSEAEDR